MWRAALEDQPPAVGIRPRALAETRPTSAQPASALVRLESQLRPCPGAGRGKRPAPMTRLTAPAEPDALATPQDGCRRRVHAGRRGVRQRLAGAPASIDADPGVHGRAGT